LYGVRIPAGARDILVTKTFRPAIKSTKPAVQWVTVSFPGGKNGRCVMLISSVKVKNEGYYTSTPFIYPHGMYKDKFTIMWFISIEVCGGVSLQ
jgi:hypothetical protein